MNPILLLVLGLAVVLGGILWLRLHAFLALILGALLVGGLTSEHYLQQAMHAKFYGELVRQNVEDEFRQQVDRVLRESKLPEPHAAQPHAAQPHADQSQDWSVLRSLASRNVAARDAELQALAESKADSFVRSHPVLTRITIALGSTFEKIGLLIVLACVVGRCLLASGAAERIVRSALALVGPRGAPIAFSASSFLLSIPVFFDSVYLLVIPLAKASWLKLRKNYLLFVLALVTGGTMTHSLVPPTPGPLFVAEELGVNLGMMILVGLLVGLCCTAVGLLFAMWLNTRIEIPVRDTPEALAELEAFSNRPLNELPSLFFSLLPVLLPVFLISGATIYKSLAEPIDSVPPFIHWSGNQNVALGVSAMIAMIVAGHYLRSRDALAKQTQLAMQEAGLIILVCCGGGAFGATLEQSGIGPYISLMTGSQPLDFGLLPLAFLVTAIIRGAQGSSTVAMFTGVAIVRGLVPDLAELSYHPVYLAVSIGCGSKPFPWMNDSGFWVISRMSGMTEKEALQTHTPMVTLMGFTGILVTMLAAQLFPLNG